MHQPPGYRFLPEETDELLAWTRQVESGWQPALTAPGVGADSAEQYLTLRKGQGVVFCLPGN